MFKALQRLCRMATAFVKRLILGKPRSDYEEVVITAIQAAAGIFKRGLTV